jgi:peroxiredoxin Q/BCP
MIATAGLALAVALTGGTSMAAELKAGDAAPNFELTGSDGKSYSLGGLKGTTIVIAWYPKAFTGG